MSRYLSFLGNLLLWLVVAFNAWFLWPSSLGGGTTFVVVSGSSMEPLYSPGDLVVARKGTPAIGDVVVYRPEGLGDAKVVHQIVGGDGETGWDVKGVNNSWLDEWHPTDREVAGVVVVRIGADNRLGTLILSPLFWAVFLLVAIGLLLWPEKPDEDVDGAAAQPEPAVTGSSAPTRRARASSDSSSQRRRRDDVPIGAGSRDAAP